MAGTLSTSTELEVVAQDIYICIFKALAVCTHQQKRLCVVSNWPIAMVKKGWKMVHPIETASRKERMTRTALVKGLPTVRQ